MKIIKDFVIRSIADEYIMVGTGKTAKEYNGLMTITDTGKFIWDHIEKASDKEELLRLILSEYDVEEEIALSDLEGFIDAMMEQGIFEYTDPVSKW